MSSRDKLGEQLGQVVVGYDGSADSRDVLAWAVDYAASMGCALSVLAAWDWPVILGSPFSLAGYDPEHSLRTSLRRALHSLGVGRDDVRVMVQRGRAATLLVDASRDADLLVVGRRGASGVVHLILGSTSMQCLSQAHCPVVIVPPSQAMAR